MITFKNQEQLDGAICDFFSTVIPEEEREYFEETYSELADYLENFSIKFN